MKEIMKKISEEHELIFPKANIGTQILKLEEEFSELENAENFEEVIKELADCFIVCCGIYRFSRRIANLCASNIIDCVREEGIRDIFKSEVIKKWEFNKKRKWILKNGIYHHIGEDEYDK